jgi:signal transduction histidine kinase
MLSSEQALRDQLGATAVTLRDAARATAGWNAVILLFALAFGVVVTFVIARSMQVPLRALRRAALDVADKQLPAAVAGVREGSTPLVVEPVPVRTSEEIGQVARAFDAVHFQAVRLAAEQAQLRANVDDMFVNLSRRSQGLVQRQLKLIDSLERSEEDPEALDHLFQLDHLATRMRRNSENLLVLAGTESAKRSGPPVRLVDVLRAAVSEVEQYQRLVLQPPPGVLVLGRAAGDLVHLLAEVLDNATLFSPRDSQVTISSRALEDSPVVIEVNDRGVGMGKAELMEANERLATSPTVDASVSRRMGLFVVGRLASRHGIRVTMRRGLDGVGVTAAIALPPRLVRPIESVADGLPDSAPVPQVRKPAVDGRARRDAPAAAGVNGNSASAVNSGDRAGENGLDAESSEDRAPSPPPGAASAPELPRRAPGRAATSDTGVGGHPERDNSERDNSERDSGARQRVGPVPLPGQPASRAGSARPRSGGAAGRRPRGDTDLRRCCVGVVPGEQAGTRALVADPRGTRGGIIGARRLRACGGGTAGARRTRGGRLGFRGRRLAGRRGAGAPSRGGGHTGRAAPPPTAGAARARRR